MDVNELYKAFEIVRNSENSDNTFRAISVFGDKPHKIGCSSDGLPMFFIECIDKELTSDIKLEGFNVLFNRKCSVLDIDANITKEKYFTIVTMKNNNVDMQKYFFQVIFLVLMRLPNKPKTLLLKVEISKLIELFTAPPKFSKDTVKGLWAELFVIEQGRNPEYLAKAWHSDPNAKYDFNDSDNKIEVKATSGSSRTHVFALEQLNPNSGSSLLIASVFVNQTGLGKSIFDLLDSICAVIKDTEVQLKAKEQVFKTIGPHVEEANKLVFDYTYAVDSYRLYNYNSIPSIPIDVIPVEVTNIHFRSDLSNVAPIQETDPYLNNTLFASL